MRRSGKDWYRNEKEVMELLGLKQVPGSGSSWIAREDGENDNVLCQLKSTDKGSIRVQLQDIHELQINAAISKKIPVFAIQFRESNEVFLVVSPIDLQFAAKYLKDPTIVREDNEVEADFGSWKPIEVVKSSESAREEFQRANERKYSRKEKKAT